MTRWCWRATGRRGSDYWQHIEAYLHPHAGAKFSHGVCPECYEEKLRPRLIEGGLDAPPYKEMQRRIDA